MAFGTRCGAIYALREIADDGVRGNCRGMDLTRGESGGGGFAGGEPGGKLLVLMLHDEALDDPVGDLFVFVIELTDSFESEL